MKKYYTWPLLVTFALLQCHIANGQDNTTPKPTQRASLPEDPCDVLTPAQVSAITGLEVTTARRVPSIAKVVQAGDENREPDPGTICSYETGSDFGAITIFVPAVAERRAAVYWGRRAKYFETFPGSAKPVAGLGKDAWAAGGNTLHVLIGEGQYFSLSTQMYQPGSGELLVKLARSVIGHRQ
jgi:hypothetical protein